MFGRATIRLGIGPHSSVNLECRSETCCARLAGNTERKKSRQKSPSLSTIGKNLLSTNICSTCPDNMVNFGPLTAEIGSGVWDTLQISTGFASWQRYCTASSSRRQPHFAPLNRGRHIRSAGRPSRWTLTHILVLHIFSMVEPFKIFLSTTFFLVSSFQLVYYCILCSEKNIPLCFLL